MKLLKLIPAAAIALTAFTTFEAKAEKVCVVNNATDTINVYVKNDTKSQTKEISNNLPPSGTGCAKLGDINVDIGDTFDVYVKEGSFQKTCISNSVRSDSTSGETKTRKYFSNMGMDPSCS